MNQNQKTVLSIFFILALFVVAACNPGSTPVTPAADNNDTAPATEAATASTQIAPGAEVTIEVTEEPDTLVTSEPSYSNITSDNVYSIAVNYALQGSALSPSLPAAPEGFKWVLVVASLQSSAGGQEQTISRNALALVDANNNRYLPEEPDEFTEPPLVGGVAAPNMSLQALARFAIPEDAEAAALEWCPGGEDPCRQPIRSPIP